MTIVDLTDRVPVYVAIERALTPDENKAFHENRLVGTYSGAEPGDWIADAVDRDDFLGSIEPWMNDHAGQVIDELVTIHQLPRRITEHLILAARYATHALIDTHASYPRRSTAELAYAAALWARGYAEGIGWQPTVCPDCGDLVDGDTDERHNHCGDLPHTGPAGGPYCDRCR